MDLVRQLGYFLAVAEELHFGRAARRLHMAQPPLSQRIRRLEQEYGTPLFDRSGGRVRLTPAGAALRAEAPEILARVERSYRLVRQAAAGRAAILRAAAPPDTPGRVLATLAAAFTAARPGTDLDLQAVTTADQLDRLAAGDLDAGVLQHPLPPDATGLNLGPTIAVPQGVVLSRTSPLAARTEVGLADLTGHGLVLFPREAAPGRYDETLEACRRHGFAPTAVRHAVHSEFLLGLVAAGADVAFDDGAVARKEPRVVWRPLAGAPITWRLSAAWPSTDPHPAATAFAQAATDALGAAAPPPVSPPTPDSARPWTVVFSPPDQR